MAYDGNHQINPQIQMLRNDGSNIKGIDYDASKFKLYYTDIGKRQIYQMNLAGSQHSVNLIVTNILAYPQAIGVDWESDNIYWTDYFQHWIGVAKSDGTYPKVLISGNITQPRAIAVNARDG